MASKRTIEKRIVIEKLAVITFDDIVNEMEFRRYLKRNWKTLTLGLNDGSTILFIAGIHGEDTGKLGPIESIQTLKNQFEPEVLDADWLLEDKEKRDIKFEFLDIPDFFVNKETREIDETGLVSKIKSINPQITIMMICYSQILELRFLLEEKGLFAEMRINRDLSILSNGQILTMNDVQKEFIQTIAHEDHVEKNVIVTGPVGSGKTFLGLETINIKKSHYKKKHGISSSDCKKKLRVIIVIGTSYQKNMLKHQLENSESHKDCSLEVISEYPNSEDLTGIFQANENYKFYFHTLILLDEIARSQMCKVNLEEDQAVDYIYCLRYKDTNAIEANVQPFEVTDTTISCNLEQRQRSSQQILDLADYLWMHQTTYAPIRRWNSGKSFSSEVPLWVELVSPKSFFDYFKDKFESDDVMLLYNNQYNLNDIEEFCREQKWRCTERRNVKGSEASITILYDLYGFDYEFLTRAKTQLVIVTIDGKQSCLSSKLQDIEKGNHNDKVCEEYCKDYKKAFDQELPDCQFNGNKSKIQNLFRKVHIDADGIETEVQFDYEISNDEDFQIAAAEYQELNEPNVVQDAPTGKSDKKNSKKKDVKIKGKTSLRTKMKNLFRRK